jgi:hypothetical protein
MQRLETLRTKALNVKHFLFVLNNLVLHTLPSTPSHQASKHEIDLHAYNETTS